MSEPDRAGRQPATRRWLSALSGGGLSKESLAGDGVAGLVVAILLVPQSMAYALLAGLPPEVGLYASVVPLVLYAFLGTSTTLAVGPVAIVSLLVASGLGGLAEPGTAAYLAYALALALMVGVIQGGMGLARLGFLVSFLSHAVLAGFTSAAALVIAVSQIAALLGLEGSRGATFFGKLWSLVSGIGRANPAAVTVGGLSILLLLSVRHLGPRLFARLGLPPRWSEPLSRTGPLVAVVVGTLLTVGFAWHETASLAIVGSLPAGLPSLTWPGVDGPGVGGKVLAELLPTALAISLVGFLESFAVAKALAARRRESIDPNRELVALGAANLGAAFTGGYPVTGGFSRSLVNFTAGARSRVAGSLTAILVALALAFLTPWFFYLPKASLAAIIVVAVLPLADPRAFLRIWRYCRADGLAFAATFAVVLAVGVEQGIMVGALVALLLHLWRTTRPHVAIVGRVGDSEHFRNVLRHEVETWPNLLLVRIDESLYFGNAQNLEQRLLEAVAERPEIEHLVLIASAVNFIDGSALETLETLRDELESGGVTLHLAEVKGPVMDRLQRASFVDGLGDGEVFLSTQEAVDQLAG